ncbi:hypothetical protein HY250_02460 [Candidatus Azambacteria bacterium]|nr:hypothetical protein [Candidatus Azambacteria bacterium]MBI3685244.1 hypothetical protein [Candidatus Azambacteria bacterium]
MMHNGKETAQQMDICNLPYGNQTLLVQYQYVFEEDTVLQCRNGCNNPVDGATIKRAVRITAVYANGNPRTDILSNFHAYKRIMAQIITIMLHKQIDSIGDLLCKECRGAGFKNHPLNNFLSMPHRQLK